MLKQTTPFSAMAITNKTRKLLWGKSGNRCAFCRIVMIMEASTNSDESVVGDECHIVSGKPNGPRYDPEFPKEKLDSCQNLLLLCRVHHKMIDDQPETFTTPILHQLKEKHEVWVKSSLDVADLLPKLRDENSYEAVFLEIKEKMSELIHEMQDDLKNNEFVREFFLLKKSWAMNYGDTPRFSYFYDDHNNLDGKVQILENHGLVYDVSTGKTKKYRMAEEFVDLILG